MIGARTRVVALLGDPVDHSLSPRIQNAALRHEALDAVYVALRAGATEVPGLLRGIARAGGAGNVTVPHKRIAADSVDEPSETVRETGACNTYWLDEGTVRGENTDVEGFRGAVRSLLGRDASGLRVLLLGAGGAARGALVALGRDRAAEVVVWNRTRERADEVVASTGSASLPPRARAAVSVADLADVPFDLIVNATSVGMKGADLPPVDLDRLRDPGAVLDLVYRPDETPLVRRARELGLPASDGGEMLVLQGAEAFRIWWGRAAPLAVMRDALRAARLDGGAGTH